jgi:hypothetical protein
MKTRQAGSKYLWGALALAILTIGGCGGRVSNTFNAASETLSTTSGDYAETASVASNTASGAGAPAPGSAAKSGAGNGSVGALVQPVVASPRKIIYTAEVDLVVENLSKGAQELARLVRESGGYIADTNISGQSGSQRSGTWKARVPVERYDAFMADAARLGEVRSIRSSSQDVTAEYTDVAARIANKQIEERRLRRHLEASTGKLSEILQVERELSRVRGEVEQAQGRIRVLANLSSLTTVTLTLSEIKNYVPPSPPTFATQVGRQFSGSVSALREFAKGILLFLVALAPWLVVGVAFALPARALWRRFGLRPAPASTVPASNNAPHKTGPPNLP